MSFDIQGIMASFGAEGVDEVFDGGTFVEEEISLLPPPPPNEANAKRELSYADDNIPTYNKTAYAIPYTQLKPMDRQARDELRTLLYHYNAIKKSMNCVNTSFKSWSSRSPNLKEWYETVFKPGVEELLKEHPKGFVLKNDSMSPKDSRNKEIRSEAVLQAVANAKEMYPHLKEVDPETLNLLRNRALFKLYPFKSAEAAFSCLLKSNRMIDVIDACAYANKEFSLWLKPFDEDIDPLSEKRCAVVINPETAAKEANSKSASDPARVIALTSYSIPDSRLARRELPSNHLFPQLCLQRAQKFVSDAKSKIIPSPATKSTVVDLCLKIDTNAFVDPNLEDSKTIFIERNPFIPEPQDHIILPNEDKYIAKVFKSFLKERCIKGVASTLAAASNPNAKPEELTKICEDAEKIASDEMNQKSPEYPKLTQSIEKMEGTLDVPRTLKKYIGPIATTDLNRFHWFRDKELLYRQTDAPQVKVDIFDYYAVYTLGAPKRNIVPVTFSQFNETYFAQNNHQTVADEAIFFNKIYDIEQENQKLAQQAKQMLQHK